MRVDLSLQLALLSGKSTSALAEKEKEAGDLRMRLSSTEHEVQNERRKSKRAAEELSRLQMKVRACVAETTSSGERDFAHQLPLVSVTFVVT